MKLKAMMDNDPLSRAILPTFCTPSTMPFYGLGSAGSSYSAATLSGRSPSDQFTSLHDPLTRHPVSAGPRTTTPFPSLSAGGLPLSFPGANTPNSCFRHPKPIKVEPHNRRQSAEGAQKEEQERQEAERHQERERHQELERKENLRQETIRQDGLRQETERAQQVKRQEEEARLREEDKRLEACEALQALKSEAVIDKQSETKSEAMDTSSSSDDSPKENEGAENKTPDVTNVKVEESVEEADNDNDSLEEDSIVKRGITYQCCLCEYTSPVLSNLTSHLEGKHSLYDYVLIKSLLACLGDIGPKEEIAGR